MKTIIEKDKTIIEGLKRKIEEKLSWGTGSSWSQHQFEELGERINNETGILLSTNTMKRFFGKIQSSGSPSKTTLNTFARYCGFDSFYNFAESISENHGTLKDKTRKQRLIINKQHRNLILLFLLIIAFSITVVAIFHQIRKQKIIASAQFSQAWESGFVPFTQIFKYHVDPTLTDTIYFNEYYKGSIALSSNDSIFSWMHFVPGFRKVRFVANTRVLWESSYMVKTQGWLFIFPWGGMEPRKYIPLENNTGYLSVSDETLAENKIDLELDGGWAHYFNMQNYDATGTDFRLITTFRNPLKTGTQQCQDVIISIECQTFEFKVHFTQIGCQKFAEINLGDEHISGIQNDLTALTFEMDNWQNISMQSKNGIFSIFNGNQLLFEKPWSGNPGNITGLHFSFRGNGQVDDVALFDNKEERVYFNDFK